MTATPTAAEIVAALAPTIRERGIRSTARECGMSGTALAYWLSGQRNPGSLDDLVRLASACGHRLEVRLVPPRGSKPVQSTHV